MTKLMLSNIAPQNQTPAGFTTPGGMQMWPQDQNHPNSPFHFQHPVSYQTNSLPTTNFLNQLQHTNV